jgi:DNA-binding MarR family transcriptional regulator
VLRAQGAPYALSPNAINQRRFNTLSSGGMTNILHEMEKRGLVERIPDPSDGRGILIRLTEHALNIIDAAVEARVAQEHRWIAALGPKERASLEALLRKLLASLEPVAEPSAGFASVGSSGVTSRRRPAARKPVRRRAGRR